MKLKIIIFFIVILIYSCNNQNSTKDDKRFIELLASEYPLQVIEEGNILPSKYNGYILYIKYNNKQAVKTNVNALIRLYDKSYKSKRFRDFLEQVFNQKIKLNESEEFIYFHLNNRITNDYENLGYENFKHLYFLPTSDIEEFDLKPNIKPDELDTIFYYCFINNYLYSGGEYGPFSIRKFSDFF
jgi:hypothetical protein